MQGTKFQDIYKSTKKMNEAEEREREREKLFTELFTEKNAYDSI